MFTKSKIGLLKGQKTDKTFTRLNKKKYKLSIALKFGEILLFLQILRNC